MNWKAFLFILVISVSCKSDEVKIPKNVLSQEKMTNLLVEIHLSDALAADERIEDVKLLNEIKKAYFTSVLEQNGISMLDFEKSLVFYQKNLDLLFGVYEEVMEVLTKKEADLNGEKTNESTKIENPVKEDKDE